MREIISILIVDDNYEFGDMLAEKLNMEYDIRVVGVARDGFQAIEMIERFLPDLVVLDIIMPNLDGIGVLEKLAEMGLEKKPTFIILSSIGQDAFIQKAIALGAQYYIVKPFDIDVMIERVRQVYNEIARENLPETKNARSFFSSNIELLYDLELEVTNLMREVGIPAHMAGYQYIREAIIQSIDNDNVFGSVTKVLYPIVAMKFNTTPQKVERSIRNAIESAWARGNPDSIDSLFGYSSGYNTGKPTNTEFIAMMADRMKLILKNKGRYT